MAKKIIVAIGGTGMRFAEAFIHLAAAGIVPRDEYEFCFVDMDFESGDYTSCTGALDHYIQAKSRLAAADADFMKADLSLIKDNNGNPAAWKLDNHMSALLKAGTVYDNDTKVEALARKDPTAVTLMECFMNAEELRGRELKKGFFGHPDVGAAVISAMFNSPEFNAANPLMQTIRNHIQTDIHVTLIASSFGATGASIFPNLAKKLKNYHTECPAATKGRLTIDGVLALPYYKLPPVEGAHAVQGDAFLKESIAILDYYYSNPARSGIDAFDRLYFAGADDLNWLNSNSYCEGGANQKHWFMPTDLVGALLIKDSFLRPVEESGYFCFNRGTNGTKIGLSEGDENKFGVFAEFALAMEEYFLPHILSLVNEPGKCAAQRGEFLRVFSGYTKREMKKCRDGEGILKDIAGMREGYTAARQYFMDYFRFMHQIHLQSSAIGAVQENYDVHILRPDMLNQNNNNYFRTELDALYGPDGLLRDETAALKNMDALRSRQAPIWNSRNVMSVGSFDNAWSALQELTGNDLAAEALKEYAGAAYGVADR